MKESVLKNKVRVFRFNHGDMTQEELSKKVGVTRQTIHAIEKGKFNPSVKLALEIAKFFDVRVEDIFFLDGEKMIKSFVFVVLAGIICPTIVMLYGNLGYISFAIWSCFPLVINKKTDEREQQILANIASITLCLYLLLLPILGVLQKVFFQEFILKFANNWCLLSVSILVSIYGIVGIIVFYRNKFLVE